MYSLFYLHQYIYTPSISENYISGSIRTKNNNTTLLRYLVEILSCSLKLYRNKRQL